MSLVTKINEGFMRLAQLVKGKQDRLNFDTVPTQDSNNPVTSGGVYDAIQSVGVPFRALAINNIGLGGRGFNAPFVVSTMRNSWVSYTLNSTITGTAAGGITFLLLVNNAEVSAVRHARIASTDQLVQRGNVSAFVPAGAEVKLIASAGSGISYSLSVGQEVIF